MLPRAGVLRHEGGHRLHIRHGNEQNEHRQLFRDAHTRRHRDAKSVDKPDDDKVRYFIAHILHRQRRAEHDDRAHRSHAWAGALARERQRQTVPPDERNAENAEHKHARAYHARLAVALADAHTQQHRCSHRLPCPRTAGSSALIYIYITSIFYLTHDFLSSPPQFRREKL